MLRSLFGKRGRRSPRGLPSTDENITHAAEGDVFTIAGPSAQFDEAYFIVEAKNRYEGPNGEWYELVGVDGETRVSIEWSPSETQLVTATIAGRPIGLSTVGLRPNDLVRMDEEQSLDNRLSHDGQSFLYRNSYEAAFFRGGTGPGEGFYLWEFAAEDMSRVLSVVKWEGAPFEVHVSDVVSADDISVYKRDSGQGRRSTP